MGAEHYVIDVRSILEDLGATLSLDSDLDLSEVCLGTETFVPLRPAHLLAEVTNSGAGIVLRGTIDVEFGATCSRCLRDFPLQLTAPIEGFYVLPGHDDEIPEEQEVSYIREGSIDIMEQIQESLALELPFAPLHAADCPGICPQCGADRAEGPCGCGPDVSKSPFAALKDLLPPE